MGTHSFYSKIYLSHKIFRFFSNVFFIIYLLFQASQASAQEVKLNFPSLNINFNIAKQMSSNQLFIEQMEAPVFSDEEINIFTHHRKRFSLPGDIFRNMDAISRLMAPGSSQGVDTGRTDLAAQWVKDLHDAEKPWRKISNGEGYAGPILTEQIRLALTANPVVRKCRYYINATNQKYDKSYGKFFYEDMALYFWTATVDQVLRPEALRATPTKRSAIHPFIVIGPPVDVCPDTFGEALKIVAAQLPRPIPAEASDFPQKVAEQNGWIETPEVLAANFRYLAQTDKSFFQEVLEGKPSTGGSAANKIQNFLAYHRAFSQVCRSSMDSRWAEYVFYSESEFGEYYPIREMIWVKLSDLPQVYKMAASLIPVIQAEYQEEPSNDFSLERVFQIHEKQSSELTTSWRRILEEEGCDSEVVVDLRKGLEDIIPQMEVEEGDSALSMVFHSDMGMRSMMIRLSAPYDPDSVSVSRTIISSDFGEYPLGADYGGRLLSYLAVGDFTAARLEGRKPTDEAIRQMRAMGPPGYNPVADFYEWAFRKSEEISPFNGVITSYIVRRVQILGSCGDPLVPVTQQWVEIETTRNGLGTEIGSREVGRGVDEVMVPPEFKYILDREEDIRQDLYSEQLVDSAIRLMSCDSDMRRHLEANMIAYNKGTDPVWVSPEISKRFSSDEPLIATGESAYIYTTAQDVEALIKQAGEGGDARLSLKYDLAKVDDRIAATMNLLSIDGHPAIAFDTRYIGNRAGNFRGGRTLGMILTCDGEGMMNLSQFLWSSQPNELSFESTYSLTFRGFSVRGAWTLPVRLEDAVDTDGQLTLARFRGKIPADEKTFVGLRPTSNFSSFVNLMSGGYPLSWGVDGDRIKQTIGSLVDFCRATNT